VVYDPELEAFFKKVARRLEREITSEADIQGEEGIYPKEEEPADKSVRIKEDLITYRKIEVPKENVTFEKTENPEAASDDTVRQATEGGNLIEQGYYPEEQYASDAETSQEQIVPEQIIPEQIIPEESLAGESFHNTDSYKSPDTKEYSYNSIYLPGKFDSIFSEAGMNYEKNFGYLVRMESTVKQIEECLEMILSDYTKINHLIITGEKKSGKTTLAKKISKALYGLNWINTNRVAKISALKLNGISLVNRKDKLVNSSLIIEEAGKLDTSAAEQLLTLIDELNGILFVILEDKEEDINRLLQRSPNLNEIFGSRVKLPGYSNEDLLGFAFTYTGQRIKFGGFPVCKNGRLSVGGLSKWIMKYML